MSSQAKSQIYRYQLLSKNALTADETDLYELTHLAGVVMDPNVFKIIIDLQRMNVAPTAIERMLKSMVSQHYRKVSLDPSDITDSTQGGSTASKTRSSRARTDRK